MNNRYLILQTIIKLSFSRSLIFESATLILIEAIAFWCYVKRKYYVERVVIITDPIISISNFQLISVVALNNRLLLSMRIHLVGDSWSYRWSLLYGSIYRRRRVWEGKYSIIDATTVFARYAYHVGFQRLSTILEVLYYTHKVVKGGLFLSGGGFSVSECQGSIRWDSNELHREQMYSQRWVWWRSLKLMIVVNAIKMSITPRALLCQVRNN